MKDSTNNPLNWFGALFLICFVAMVSASEKEEAWLLISTEKLQLTVMKGERSLAVFKNISIGRNGATALKERGDEKTPLGEFRIGWINRKSRYHIFYGFTYPSLDGANTAFSNGVINLDTYAAIRSASKNNQVPPQNTVLGGQIGIHGLGHADPGIHHDINWTEGCIALTNEQIDRLGLWIGEGTRVVVK